MWRTNGTNSLRILVPFKQPILFKEMILLYLILHMGGLQIFEVFNFRACLVFASVHDVTSTFASSNNPFAIVGNVSNFL